MRLYAIGDIHGQLDMLRAAHARIEADRRQCRDDKAPVVHLGDLVDRGPDSRGVIEHLSAGMAEGHPWLALLGNHDRLFRNFLADPHYQDPVLRKDLTWFAHSMGGAETIRSYGVTPRVWTSARKAWEALDAAVPDHHRAFLSGLRLSHETPDLILVHAGIRPGVPMAEQIEDDLVWIRSPFLEDTSDHGKIVVHGHTPVHQPEHYGNRIDLDTGAGFGRPLTAAVFEGRDCFVLTERGRRALPAPVAY